VPPPKDHLDKFPWQMGRLWHHLHNYNDYKIKKTWMHIMHKTKRMSCMMSPHVAWSFWNMTFFDIESKVFAMFSWRTIQLGWRSRVHLMSWIIASHPPLVATSNWCGKKCVAKVSWNWRHKTWLVSRYNVFVIVMKWIPLEGLVMAKRQATPRTRAICGM